MESKGLRCRISWPARRVPERKIREQEPWHADVLDDVLSAAHDNGRDAVLLQHACRQTDGLVADGAIGNKHRCIDLLRLAAGEDLATVDLKRHTVATIA